MIINMMLAYMLYIDDRILTSQPLDIIRIIFQDLGDSTDNVIGICFKVFDCFTSCL